ncbi:hypothetical protein Mapa_012856 [Marchantia paleacea]|nr:hypothetical protein Mapa_012856 [Marchantia paleacea]
MTDVLASCWKWNTGSVAGKDLIKGARHMIGQNQTINFPEIIVTIRNEAEVTNENLEVRTLVTSNQVDFLALTSRTFLHKGNISVNLMLGVVDDKSGR